MACNHISIPFSFCVCIYIQERLQASFWASWCNKELNSCCYQCASLHCYCNRGNLPWCYKRFINGEAPCNCNAARKTKHHVQCTGKEKPGWNFRHYLYETGVCSIATPVPQSHHLLSKVCISSHKCIYIYMCMHLLVYNIIVCIYVCNLYMYIFL